MDWWVEVESLEGGCDLRRESIETLKTDILFWRGRSPVCKVDTYSCKAYWDRDGPTADWDGPAPIPLKGSATVAHLISVLASFHGFIIYNACILGGSHIDTLMATSPSLSHNISTPLTSESSLSVSVPYDATLVGRVLFGILGVCPCSCYSGLIWQYLLWTQAFVWDIFSNIGYDYELLFKWPVEVPAATYFISR